MRAQRRGGGSRSTSPVPSGRTTPLARGAASDDPAFDEDGAETAAEAAAEAAGVPLEVAEVADAAEVTEFIAIGAASAARE